MALRRSLGSVLQSLGRLALAEGGLAAAAAPAQQHALPTLTSLRAFQAWGAHAPAGCSAVPLGSGGRCFAAAATSPARQQAAPAAAQAAAAAEEESLEEIRSRIFGTHIGNGLRSGRKVLRRPLLGAKLEAWYPGNPLKHDPLMLNLKAENAKLKLDRLRRRGKAPPKKGAGKRAGKKR